MPVSAKDIGLATKKNPLLQKVLISTKYGWNEKNDDKQLEPFWSRRTELTVQDGVLLWGLRVIIPPTYRKTMLALLHESHVGIVRMKAIARSHFWWPKLDEEIEQLAKACYACAQLKPDPQTAPLHSWAWPERAWQRLHIDYAGPFLGHDFLVVIDAHSDFPFVIPVRDISATETVNALYTIFSEHGLQEQIVSDNGGQFVSASFDKFCQSHGISHIRTSAYHPSTNGKAERFVRTFKSALTAMKSEPGTTEQKLTKFLFRYHTTPHTTTCRSPSELLYNRRLRTVFDLFKPSCREHTEKSLLRQQHSHNLHSRARNFCIDDRVFVRNFVGSKKWRAGIIVGIAGSLTYDIRVGSEVLRRHIDYLITNTTQRFSDFTAEEQQRELDRRIDAELTASQPETNLPPSSSFLSNDNSAKGSQSSLPTAGLTLQPVPQNSSTSESSLPATSPQKLVTPALRPQRERHRPKYFHEELSTFGSNKPK
jgi:hypothetical protein